MTVDRLGSVDPLSSYNKTGKTQKPVRAERSDSIEVSPEARAQAEVLMARDAVNATAEVRAERIAELRAKINDPNYVNQAIVEHVAEGLLKTFGL